MFSDSTFCLTLSLLPKVSGLVRSCAVQRLYSVGGGKMSMGYWWNGTDRRKL